MHLTRQPIHVDDVIANEDGFKSGADVLFLGIVRDQSYGKKVLYLEYEAYPEMAERLLGEWTERALKKWRLDSVKVLHRLGKILPSEIAVAIDVRSPHREEAYQASRFLIEEIKHQLPLWKKEYFADGSKEWGGCHQEGKRGARERELINEML